MTEIVGRYITVGGHRLYWEQCGEGQAIVCIHTAGQHALQWRFVLPYLGDRGYRAIALDLPGHGKSLLKDWRPISVLHEYAEIVWAFTREIGLERPVFMGCSIGADITLDVGVHHAADARALIVLDGAARTPTFPERVIRMGLEDAGVPSASDQAFYGALGVSGSDTEEARRLEIAWTTRARDPKVLANDLLGWIGHDVRASLGRVTCPVLLVRGEEDFFVPRELLEETRAGLADAEVVELAGVGHFPHMESAALLDLLSRFLKSRDI